MSNITDPANLNYARPIRQNTQRSATTTAYRSAITAMDRLAAPTLVTLANVAGTTGTLLASTSYKAAVCPGSVSGNGLTSNILTTSTTADAINTHTLRLTVPQVTGADYYDVFLSTDAQPKWVAKVTEAQRALGCTVSAVGTVIATTGGAGLIDIRLVGTGAANNAAPFNLDSSVNFSGLTAVDCSGFPSCNVTVAMATNPPLATATCSLQAYDLQSDGSYAFITSQAFTFLNDVAHPAKQDWVVTAHGGSLQFICSAISGTNASLTLTCQPME